MASKYDIIYTYPTNNPDSGRGHPGHTTAEQDDKVAQLRAQLEANGYAGCERLDTHALLRFLRARRFDVELAKSMFVACEKWRVEFGVDELVRSFEYAEKARVFEYYPQYYHKTDRDGRPVYFEQCGKIDLAHMYKITSEERMLRNLVVEYERLADSRLPACSRMAGHLVETCCTVMDLAGVGITSVSQVYGFVKKVMAISQNYYPERLGKLYIINAPWGFSSAFKLIKGCLDPVTVEKISVLGSSYKAELLAQIPAENLPKEFGGLCQCAAQGGCRLADQGPWNDPAFAAPVAAAASPSAPFSDPEKAPDMATTVTAVATAVA